MFDDIEHSFFYQNPVFIVSTPRSGSNLLFEQLTALNNIWSIGAESHSVFAAFPHLQFENSSLDSACLTPQHADSQTAYLFKLLLFSQLKDNLNQPILGKNINSTLSNRAVFLEKTPRNALNIPFLRVVFPKARFIYLYREPKQNVASIIEAWKKGKKTGQFVTFQNLPNWDRKNWCLLLPRNWRKMNGKSLAQISYFQWQQSNQEIIFNLKQMPHTDWIGIEYKSLIKEPFKQLSKLIDFCKIESNLNKNKVENLSLSKTSTSKPSKDKWRKHEKKMEPLFPIMQKKYIEFQSFCK